MPADLVLDNSSTWSYLLKHLPKEWAEYLITLPFSEQEHFELTCQSVSRDGNGNTNLKNRAKVVMAFFRRDPDWEYAYRFDVSYRRDDANASLTDWGTFYIVYSRRVNPDVFEANDEVPDLFASVERHRPALPMSGGFARRYSGEKAARRILEAIFAANKWNHSFTGAEDVFSKAVLDDLRANGDATSNSIRKAPDGIITSAGRGSFRFDSKTTTGGAFFLVEIESFRKVSACGGILFCTARPEESNYWCGAIFAKEFTPEIFYVYGTKGSPGVKADCASILKMYPHADITVRPNDGKMSGMPMLEIPRTALLPIQEFFDTRLNTLRCKLNGGARREKQNGARRKIS